MVSTVQPQYHIAAMTDVRRARAALHAQSTGPAAALVQSVGDASSAAAQRLALNQDPSWQHLEIAWQQPGGSACAEAKQMCLGQDGHGLKVCNVPFSVMRSEAIQRMPLAF